MGDQLECAALPIAAYDDYDFARDDGRKRNFWRATNLTGEPNPVAPAIREEFVVLGVPDAEARYFAVVKFDDARNRSPLSNVARTE